MMVLNGEERLECEVHVDGVQLEHVLEFKYLRCALNESGTDESECHRKGGMGKRLQVVLGTGYMLGIYSLSVLGSCMRLLVPVFLYGSEAMVWKEREKV